MGHVTRSKIQNVFHQRLYFVLINLSFYPGMWCIKTTRIKFVTLSFPHDILSIKSHKFFPVLVTVWSPCLVWYMGREVMKRNGKYVFLYIYFTSRTKQRYLFTGWVFKTTIFADTCLKNRLSWTHNKRFMESLFGVIASGTVRPWQTEKEKPHLAHIRKQTQKG